MVNLRVSGWSPNAATGYLCHCFRCRDDLGRLGGSCNSPARRKASSPCDQPLAHARECPAGCGRAGDRRDLAQPRTVTCHAHGHLCDRSHPATGCLPLCNDRRNCRVPAVIPGRGHRRIGLVSRPVNVTSVANVDDGHHTGSFVDPADHPVGLASKARRSSRLPTGVARGWMSAAAAVELPRADAEELVRRVQPFHGPAIGSGAFAVARTTAARWPRSGSWRRSGRRPG